MATAKPGRTEAGKFWEMMSAAAEEKAGGEVRVVALNGYLF